MHNLVHVTGVGIISAAGVNLNEAWERMKEGQTFINRIKRWDVTGLYTPNAGEIYLSDDEILGLLLNPPSSHQKLPCERGELLFLKALEEALSRAELDPEILKDRKVGIFVGTSLSGFTLLEEEYTSYLKSGSKLKMRSMLVFPLSTVADRLAYEYGIKGVRYVFSTACSSSLHSVFWATEFLRTGKIDIAICGGTDPLSLISLAGFSSLRSLARNACSPFSAEDPGLSIGEGAGVCILESEDSMKRRGFDRSICIIGGCGGTSDAYHPTASDPTGRSIVECIKKATELLEIHPESKIYITAHGTGTPHNDIVETRAIKQAFAKYDNLKVSSLKSMIGHTLGASGIIEFAFLADSMKKEEILPTANFTEPRKGCDLDYVPNKGEKYNVEIGVKNAFAFGGNNVSVSVIKDKNFLIKGFCQTLNNEPIAIVGLGLVTPCGIGVEPFFKAIEEGKSFIKDKEPIYGFIRNNAKATKAGEVDHHLIREFCSKHYIKTFRKMDKISRLAIVAALSAIKDAGVKVTSANVFRIGLIGATGTGPLESIEKFYTDMIQQGVEKASAEVFSNTVVNAHLGYVSIELRIKGYTTVIAQGGLSDIAALQLAVESLRNDIADIVLVGATSEYSTSYHRALVDIGLHSDNFKVYDKNSNGYVPGEGSGFIVLEKLNKAISEGRKIYGIIRKVQSFGVPTFPATNRYTDNPLINLFSNANKDSMAPEVIYATGSGVKQKDYTELQALERFFPDAPVTTFTEYTGVIPGCSGIINTILWSYSNEKKVVFNLLNTTSPISESLALKEPLKRDISKALVTEISEGGMAGYIYLTKG